MSYKILCTVSALALGLAFAGGAMAHDGDTTSSNNAVGNQTDNSKTYVSDAGNDQSKALTVSDSGNDNSTHSKTNVSDNGNDQSKTIASNNDASKTIASNNDNSKTDNSTSTKTSDSGNDNSKNIDASKTIVADNGNDQSSSHTKDSYNSDSSTRTLNVRVTLSNQDLEATVSHVSFNGGTTSGGQDARSLRTGDLSASGSAYQNFAGIQTASLNTGFGSANQAATSVAANANVTFGH